MRGNTFVVSAAVASVLVISGCGTMSAGSSGRGGEPPVLRVGVTGSLGMDAAKLSSATVLGTYRIQGALPTGPTHASTYRVVSAGEASVRRVAAALGLSAPPRKHAHGWVVTAGSRELRMRDTGQWSFQRLTDTCPAYVVDVDSPDGSAGVACAVASGVVVPKPGGGFEPDPSVTPNMSAEHLRAVAAPLLSALGLDPASARVTVAAATVSVNPVVGGLPTVGYDTDVVVDNNGIRAAAGWAYPDQPAKGDTYPLISAQDALKLFDSLPRPMMGAPEIACPAVSPKSPASMPIRCGGPSWVVTVTGGRIGLELRWDGGPSGHPILVPAWFLTVRGSDTPLVLVAVSPKYLADPVIPVPAPNPATSWSGVPGSTGAGSGGSTGTGGAATKPTPMPAPGGLRLSSYAVSADGRTLTVSGWGSQCVKYGSAPVDEADGAIKVGIVVTVPQPMGMACDDIARHVSVQVTLATPLGTRTVVDRSTGAKVPLG
jgi:hypothetical protein